MAQPKMALNEKTFPNTATTPEARPATGLEFRRHFSDARVSPFDAVPWQRRTAQIGNEKGQVIFRQENVEVPDSWSQTATNIVASSISTATGTPQRETSVRQLIGRVVNTIVDWGSAAATRFAGIARRLPGRLGASADRAEDGFQFAGVVNVGVQPKPQCSAVHHSVQDNMGHMAWPRPRACSSSGAPARAPIFPRCAAAMNRLSGAARLRPSAHDGSTTLPASSRAAERQRPRSQMVSSTWTIRPRRVLDSKMKEERKAHVLIEQATTAPLTARLWLVFFQNAIIRARQRRFMQRREDRDWWTRNVADGSPAEKLRARDCCERSADSAWHAAIPACSTTPPSIAGTPASHGPHQRIESLLGVRFSTNGLQLASLIS